MEEISQCYMSCSEDLKFEVKCEFEEFCYITARCHQIHHNMNLKSKIRRKRNELKILIQQREEHGKVIL